MNIKENFYAKLEQLREEKNKELEDKIRNASIKDAMAAGMRRSERYQAKMKRRKSLQKTSEDK